MVVNDLMEQTVSEFVRFIPVRAIFLLNIARTIIILHKQDLQYYNYFNVYFFGI